MKKGNWYSNFSEDTDRLGMLDAEIEDLENDELSAGEAAFIKGYVEEEEKSFTL